MDMDIYAPPQASVEEVRPPSRYPLGVEPGLSAIEVFKRAVVLYVENLGTIAGISAIAYAPYEVIRIYVAFAALPPAETSIFNMLQIIPMVLCSALAVPAILFAILERERTPDGVGVPAALREGLRRWGSVVGPSSAAMASTFLGLMCMILPGCYLWWRYATVDPIATLEPGKNVRARSVWLSKSEPWRVLGAKILFIVPPYALLVLMMRAVSRFSHWPFPTWYATLAWDTVSTVLTTFPTVGTLVLYLSVRQRPEALAALGPLTLPWRTEG